MPIFNIELDVHTLKKTPHLSFLLDNCRIFDAKAGMSPIGRPHLSSESSRCHFRLDTARWYTEDHIPDAMRHAVRASRNALIASENAVTPPIWISDAVLEHSFNRFAKCLIRHGSNVPGPLEARRRAAKRRNTNLASTDARLPTDIDVLLSSQAQTSGGWWKATRSDAPDSVTKPILGLPFPILTPAWLTKPPPPSPPAMLEQLLPVTKHSEVKTTTESICLFRSRLQAFKSIDELRAYFKTAVLTLSGRLLCSEEALIHILDSGWITSAVREFVLDTNLNPPGSRNYQVIIENLKSKSVPFERRRRLFDIFCQAISLGLVPITDLHLFISHLQEYLLHEYGDGIRPNDQLCIHDYHRKVLTAIEESRVLTLEDLGNQFLNAWLSQIGRAPFKPPAADLIWELRRFAQTTEINLATDTICKWFDYLIQDEPRNFRDKSPYAFMQKLPASVLIPTLVSSTERLLFRRKPEQHHSHLMAQWQRLLSNLDQDIVSRLFSERAAWQALLHQSSTHVTDAQRLALVMWTAVNLCSKKKNMSILLKSLQIHTTFKQIFSSLTNNGQPDILANFVLTLNTLPLSHTKDLLKQLKHLTDGHVVVQNPTGVSSNLKKLRARGFHMLQHDGYYENLRLNFNDSLVELAESINSDLHLFAKTSRELIARDKLSFRLITRILRHNLALHSALSRSWSSRTTTTERTPDFTRDLNPQDVLELIQTLATSFSTSPVISPRQAFRKVYWCYNLLHRYGAPITAPMTRALWHAGVVRWGPDAPLTVRKWVIQQVRRVEGDKVLRSLLEKVALEGGVGMKLEDLSITKDTKLPEEILAGREDQRDGFDRRPDIDK